MAAILQFIGTPAAAKAALATVQTTNALESQSLSSLTSAFQAQVDQLGAANQVYVQLYLTHTEKTFSLDLQIDKATPVLNSQLVELSNASPAN